jgi:hypothetical protein
MKEQEPQNENRCLYAGKQSANSFKKCIPLILIFNTFKSNIWITEDV